MNDSNQENYYWLWKLVSLDGDREKVEYSFAKNASDIIRFFEYCKSTDGFSYDGFVLTRLCKMNNIQHYNRDGEPDVEYCACCDSQPCDD